MSNGRNNNFNRSRLTFSDLENLNFEDFESATLKIKIPSVSLRYTTGNETYFQIFDGSCSDESDVSKSFSCDSFDNPISEKVISNNSNNNYRDIELELDSDSIKKMLQNNEKIDLLFRIKDDVENKKNNYKYTMYYFSINDISLKLGVSPTESPTENDNNEKSEEILFSSNKDNFELKLEAIILKKEDGNSENIFDLKNGSIFINKEKLENLKFTKNESLQLSF
jgi:hypothetical protein